MDTKWIAANLMSRIVVELLGESSELDLIQRVLSRIILTRLAQILTSNPTMGVQWFPEYRLYL